MKQIYFAIFLTLLLSMLFFNQGNSQNLPTEKEAIPVSFERILPHNSAAGTDMTHWFNYGEDIWRIADDAGGDVSYFRTFLFPDSTVKVNFTSGLGAPWKHSQGQVLDPISPLFSVFSPEVTQFNAYHLDSVGFFYRYFRFQDGAPDTLIVQIFEHNNITFQPNPGWSSGASYSTVNYDYNARIGANPNYQYTYLLTNSDTISATQGFLKFLVDRPVGAGKKIAATLTYIPGNPYNIGDTIDVYVTPPPVNQRNAFISYEYRDNDKNVEPGYFNNALTASTEIRYNTSTNGWNGRYIPGTAWNAGFYHLDMAFLITFNPSSVAESEKHNIVLYPNPAEENITLDFSSNANETIRISVFDISGREVFSTHENYTKHSVQRINLETNKLHQGVYFCKVEGKEFSENLRFVKK